MSAVNTSSYDAVLRLFERASEIDPLLGKALEKAVDAQIQSLKTAFLPKSDADCRRWIVQWLFQPDGSLDGDAIAIVLSDAGFTRQKQESAKAELVRSEQSGSIDLCNRSDQSHNLDDLYAPVTVNDIPDISPNTRALVLKETKKETLEEALVVLNGSIGKYDKDNEEEPFLPFNLPITRRDVLYVCTGNTKHRGVCLAESMLLSMGKLRENQIPLLIHCTLLSLLVRLSKEEQEMQPVSVRPHAKLIDIKITEFLNAEGYKAAADAQKQEESLKTPNVLENARGVAAALDKSRRQDEAKRAATDRKDG